MSFGRRTPNPPGVTRSGTPTAAPRTRRGGYWLGLLANAAVSAATMAVMPFISQFKLNGSKVSDLIVPALIALLNLLAVAAVIIVDPRPLTLQTPPMLQNLETLARDARSWPFEQARNLLNHVLKKRLSDAERTAAKLLIDAGKADEALATFEALQKPVIFETGYGPSGLPHIGTFGEVARTTMVRNAFRALTGDHWPTRL
jgi:hypothetical protein